MSAKLLVVDDDADLLQLLSMRLTAAGYHVTGVGSAEEALAHLEAVSVAAARKSTLRRLTDELMDRAS